MAPKSHPSGKANRAQHARARLPPLGDLAGLLYAQSLMWEDLKQEQGKWLQICPESNGRRARVPPLTSQYGISEQLKIPMQGTTPIASQNCFSCLTCIAEGLKSSPVYLINSKGYHRQYYPFCDPLYSVRNAWTPNAVNLLK